MEALTPQGVERRRSAALTAVLITLAGVALLVPAALAILPLGRQVSLYVPAQHFYIVTGVSLLALVMAVLLGVAAGEIRQYKVLFLAIGFMAMAGFFAVHGLATPGFVVPAAEYYTYDSPLASGVGTSAVLSLTLPALFFAASYTRLPDALERRLPFWPGGWLVIGVVGLVVAWAALVVSQSPLVGALHLAQPPLSYLVVGMGAALLLFAARHQLKGYRAGRLSTQGSLLVAFLLLAEAQVIMVVTQPWSAAWWTYHLLMLLAVATALWALAAEVRGRRSLRTAVEQALQLEVTVGAEIANTELISALAAAIELKDLNTKGHTLRVAEYAVAIGREMGLPHPTLRVVARAGVLHDIGKLGIPDAILGKQGPLDETEWQAIRRHPQIGLEIIAGIGGMQREAEAIHSHHERMDGSGYPRGLSGAAIPLEACIVSVADTYDAVRSDRPYCKARSQEEALAIVRQEAGAHLYPPAVEALMRIAARDHARVAAPRATGASGGLVSHSA